MSESTASPGRELPRWLVWLVCALLVCFSTAVRSHTAFADPNFRQAPKEGLLKSDPGLLYYFTRRVVEAEGLVPEDFRRDPRVQHPETTDIPAEFTVGQEFLVGWAYRFLGSSGELSTFAIQVMAFFASLAILGAYALTLGCSGRRGIALMGALFFTVLPANYRTIGFVLVREDVSFPLYAMHLGALALALRYQRPAQFLAAGVTLAGALATWHAAGFLLGIELVCFFVWCLWRGRNPLVRARVWLVLVPPVLAALCVPALRAQGVLLSPVTAPVWALGTAALLRFRFPKLGMRAGALSSLVVVGLGLFFLRGTEGGYRHVYEVLLAKVRLLGRFPAADPGSISFDARLLWQGPFETLNLPWFAGLHLWVLLLAIIGLWGVIFQTRREPSGAAWLVPGFLLGCMTAWFFERLQVLPGLFLPVFAALALSLLRNGRLAAGALIVVLALQGASFAGFIRQHVNGWYVPAARQTEIAELVEWARAGLEPGEAVLGDFMNSTALLAHLETPIALQPKYETDHSRRRSEAFLKTFFYGSPSDLGKLARDRFEARYLLVDRYTLWELSRTTAGLSPAVTEPLPGTAAEVFLSRDGEVLQSVEGFTLLYRSQAPSDFFRVYRVD